MTTKKIGAAQVHDDGRVTIPVSVRQELGIESGDFVILDVAPVESMGGETDDG